MTDTKFKQKPMSLKHKKFLDAATTLSATSTCSRRHAAILVRGSKVVAVGVNTERNDARFLETKKNASVHAEVACLSRARKVGNLTGAVLYIARTTRDGQPKNSKPCGECVAAIKAAGVRKIFYTIDNEMDLYED